MADQKSDFKLSGLLYLAACGVAVASAVGVVKANRPDTTFMVPAKTAETPEIPTPVEIAPIWLEEYLSADDELIGMRLRIEDTVMNEWAKYAPVTISIPEASYSTVFPVERCKNTANTRLPNRMPKGEYNYTVSGWENGKAKVLYSKLICTLNKDRD